MHEIDYDRMYRLPFSKNDNFNGWIEVTTRCNIKCPGCYKGCDNQNHTGTDKPLAEIKAEISELIKIRNCSMISISGGEALLHPNLPEIVEYIKSKSLKSVLFTNGILLNYEILAKLKSAGLTGVTVRIDSLQQENQQSTEEQLCKKREHFAELCNRLDLYLTCTTCVDQTNLGQVKDVMLWAEENHDRVGHLLFILKRNLTYTANETPDLSGLVSVEELVDRFKSDCPGYNLAAYLGNERENRRAKWLMGFRLINSGHCLGYTDNKYHELLHIVYHYLFGKYMAILEKKKNYLYFPHFLFFSLFNHSWRKITGGCFNSPAALFNLIFKTSSVQALTIVNPPLFVDGKRDLCDSCPDAVFYNGKLVPSCVLEEIKVYGHPYEIEKLNIN